MRRGLASEEMAADAVRIPAAEAGTMAAYRDLQARELLAARGEAHAAYDPFTVDGTPGWITETGQIAFFDSRLVFVTQGVVDAANAKLAASSPMVLERSEVAPDAKQAAVIRQAGKHRGVAYDPSAYRLLNVIDSRHPPTEAAKTEAVAARRMYTLVRPTDCRQQAVDAMTGDPKGNVRFQYAIDEQFTTSKRIADPMVQVMADYLKDKQAAGDFAGLREGLHYDTVQEDDLSWAKFKGDKAVRIPVYRDEAINQFFSLPDAAQELVSRRGRFNDYASPQVGQGYMIKSEDAFEGFHKDPRAELTWNHHFAAVILEDGNDRLTLEGFQENVPPNTTNWVLDLYNTYIDWQTFDSRHGDCTNAESAVMGSHNTTFGVQPTY